MPYEKDPFIEHLAAELIAKHHPRLANARIAYLMNMTATPAKRPRLGKKRKLGSAAMVPEKYNSLTTGFDFIIEIKQDLWSRMDLETQEALLDHELEHCGWDEDGPYIRNHDVTEFRSIIERHGFWQNDLREFYVTSRVVAEQKLLFPDQHTPAAAQDRTIEIDMDKCCTKCGKKGATGSGRCLDCVGKAIVSKVKRQRKSGATATTH